MSAEHSDAFLAVVALEPPLGRLVLLQLVLFVLTVG
jgi:hypothetical protein